jgi:hypothetical protein
VRARGLGEWRSIADIHVPQVANCHFMSTIAGKADIGPTARRTCRSGAVCGRRWLGSLIRRRLLWRPVYPNCVASNFLHETEAIFDQ